MVLYGTVWYCMVLYGTVWYRMVLYGTVWYCMVLYGTVLQYNIFIENSLCCMSGFNCVSLNFKEILFSVVMFTHR